MQRLLAIGCGLLALLALARIGRAQTAGQKLTIALYAPTAPFTSASDRVDYVDRLAKQIEAQTGVPTLGLAFARASDLESAIAHHSVDFAILDGEYESEHVGQYPVLAAALVNGAISQSWALFSSQPVGGLGELSGKRLAIVSIGRQDTAFLENALLDGEVKISTYFAPKSVAVPDVPSAIQTLSLHRADVLLAPSSAGGGLDKVFEIPGIPTPAFVRVNAKLAAPLVDKVRDAVVGYGGAGAFTGWRASGAGGYADLAGRMRAREKQVVLVAPDLVRLDAAAVLQPMSLALPLPGLEDQLWTPSPPK